MSDDKVLQNLDLSGEEPGSRAIVDGLEHIELGSQLLGNKLRVQAVVISGSPLSLALAGCLLAITLFSVGLPYWTAAIGLITPALYLLLDRGSALRPRSGPLTTRRQATTRHGMLALKRKGRRFGPMSIDGLALSGVTAYRLAADNLAGHPLARHAQLGYQQALIRFRVTVLKPPRGYRYREIRLFAMLDQVDATPLILRPEYGRDATEAIGPYISAQLNEPVSDTLVAVTDFGAQGFGWVLRSNRSEPIPASYSCFAALLLPEDVREISGALRAEAIIVGRFFRRARVAASMFFAASILPGATSGGAIEAYLDIQDDNALPVRQNRAITLVFGYRPTGMTTAQPRTEIPVLIVVTSPNALVEPGLLRATFRPGLGTAPAAFSLTPAAGPEDQGVDLRIHVYRAADSLLLQKLEASLPVAVHAEGQGVSS